ncbi:hypothetical protein DAEQUDRAFT_753970 [Daedalea quercina L-15889]|uniref:Zn(2)-C6 fungal-type domain-containing protein n=1 Tax=Daedalea quercina L-15889 TaxID=1314783 RepID=A0A165U951_9APHY|nr:hypothetical protein DAEQUDRAFT_753970 [Daedalea quercina L-15889]
MTDRSLERKASTSSKKSKDTNAGQRSSTPGAPVDGSLLTPMVRSKRTPIACTECRRRQVKCSGGTPQCERCEKRGAKCEYIPIHVQRQQTAAAAVGSSGGHATPSPSSAPRSLPSTPLPWPSSGSSHYGPTTRHSPLSVRDWPEYYDLSAEIAPDSRRQSLPHSASSYPGAGSFGQSQGGASYDRYPNYGQGMVNPHHYPVSATEVYGSSPGSGGSPMGQAIDFTLSMENTSQVIPGATQRSVRASYPTQYLQGQNYHDDASGATTLHGQFYQGWTDPSDVNYPAFQATDDSSVAKLRTA